MPNPILPTGKEKEVFVKEMFNSISPSYDRINRIMTFRFDQVWRRQSLRSLNLPARSTILDLACGTGDFVKMARAQGHRCVGTDFSIGMLSHSQLFGDLVVSDALNLAFSDSSFDAVTCGFALRNFTDLIPVFIELARVLRPGGRVALLEVAQPSSLILKAGHAIYFNKLVPIIGGMLSDKNAYRYLPASVSYLPPPATIVELLVKAGFSNISHSRLTTGAAQLFTATKAG
ncbi:MAG: ubiquinone/menaquinone biosynthesis methyltransferase [Actinomycetota bacterium]|nr:ubiquinone/menaquinone biosynthesis methyltransferase [Actinomycetota bacterium]